LRLLYSNTVLQGESRKLLRLVVKKLVSPVTSVTGGEGGILTPPIFVSPTILAKRPSGQGIRDCLGFRLSSGW
jgi:hypothetical protein